ncbi:hypothetical protein SAMN05421805_101136 [Saccharopolyspora antimicrobica]|uniref:Uncharacterized protein n=1 Tax=Saccharopolyspora antimicrobica TaxID=455193 RepID=A0A1I4QJF3_9PSEU|nr:hypothetical protein ATL45_3275 [Saccharopolyspora antimicrobica]SFM39753.1 hypothetical protein SAMN05421805_101136 [Saccharopolyspora antimicrobica]
MCAVGHETLLRVTTPEPWPADGPKFSAEELERAEPRGVVHKPWRAAVAGIELVLVVALVVAGWWAWQQGTVPIHLPGPQGAIDVVTRSVGSWQASALGAMTLGGLLLLDAIRQVALAVRARRR